MIKLPAFLHEHPVESVFAGVLLFCLLFIAADGTPPQASAGTQVATSQKN